MTLERGFGYINDWIYDENKGRLKAYGKAYRARPENKARAKAYRQRPEVKERAKARAKAHSQRPEVKTRARARWRERKRKRSRIVVDHYGGKCACCGESKFEFMAIDHINGGGAKHSREVGDLRMWLYKNNFPLGYRVLCHNCNMARGLYGHCPHESEMGAEDDQEDSKPVSGQTIAWRCG